MKFYVDTSVWDGFDDKEFSDWTIPFFKEARQGKFIIVLSDVFAIPSSVHSRAGVGSNHLIQRGHARLVLSPDDVLEELGIPLESDGSGDGPGREPLDLHPVEERLYDALGPEPVHIDALCQKLDLDASSALVYLLNLEFQGCIRQLAGKQFFRVG